MTADKPDLTKATLALNKDPESWTRVIADAVASGSTAQVRNVIAMAIHDIGTLARERDRHLALIAALTEVLEDAPNPAKYVWDHCYSAQFFADYDAWRSRKIAALKLAKESGNG